MERNRARRVVHVAWAVCITAATLTTVVAPPALAQAPQRVGHPFSCEFVANGQTKDCTGDHPLPYFKWVSHKSSAQPVGLSALRQTQNQQSPLFCVAYKGLDGELDYSGGTISAGNIGSRQATGVSLFESWGAVRNRLLHWWWEPEPRGGTPAQEHYAQRDPAPPPAPELASDDYRASVLADTPFAYYPMEEHRPLGITDISGNGFHGEHVIGGLALGLPGTCGGSNLHTSYITDRKTGAGRLTAADDDVRFGLNDQDWTVEFWTERLDTESTQKALLNHRGNFNAWIFGMTDAFITAYDKTVVLSSGAGSVRSKPGCLRHVVWRRSGNTLSVYVDGTLAAALTPAWWNSVPRGHVYIGISNRGPQPSMPRAKFGHLAFYDHALTTDRIVAHYESASAAPAPPDPKYVAVGDSTTTGFSNPACVVDHVASQFGCVGDYKARPYPELVTDETFDDLSDLYRTGIWGYTIEEAVDHYESPGTQRGGWEPQLKVAERASELITVSLGANDMGFGQIPHWLGECLRQNKFLGVTYGAELDHPDCDQAANARAATPSMQADLDALFEILQIPKLRGVEVVIALYYNPYNEFKQRTFWPDRSCGLLHGIADHIVNALNEELRTRARANLFTVADFKPGFEGHGAGSAEPYVFGSDCEILGAVNIDVDWGLGGPHFDLRDSWAEVQRRFDPHPNQAGAEAQAAAVLEVIR